MKIIANPFRKGGLPGLLGSERPLARDAATVLHLLSQCPAHAPTPLVDAKALADQAGIAALWVKDERARMGLGSFKALGAAFAIAKWAAETTGDVPIEKALVGETFICASAGNHGLSVAAGAPLFGAKAVVVLAETVPENFAERLRAKGAETIRAGADYEASMDASRKLAESEGWTLLSDGSWTGYLDWPRDVMEGYLALGREANDQIVALDQGPPTHLFVQAGVGGLAAAVAATMRAHWGDDPIITVVEPDAAPAIQASIEAGGLVDTKGPVSSMGRLDCKTPSLLALDALAKDADFFMTISDEAVESRLPMLGERQLATTPSGGAGLAALLQAMEGDGASKLHLDATSRVLVIVSEQA